jgi:hypothetical protein
MPQSSNMRPTLGLSSRWQEPVTSWAAPRKVIVAIWLVLQVLERVKAGGQALHLSQLRDIFAVNGECPGSAIGTTTHAARDHDQLGDTIAIDIGKPDCGESAWR